MEKTTDSGLEFVYELYKSSLQYNLSYVYKGDFSKTLTDSILALAEANMEIIHEPTKVKKKVYFIMVEALQNITRHQEVPNIKQEEESGFFIVQRHENHYYITSCNPIALEQVEPLRSKLEKVNSLDENSLKEYYKTILANGELSSKGGAGLGLIEMARKSGNKLDFDFSVVNDVFATFFLHLKVRISEEKTDETKKDSNKSLEFAKEFYKLVLSKKLNIIYHGYFNQENVRNILVMTESSEEQRSKQIEKKVFSTSVELLQNVYKHALDEEKNSEGKRGIFLVGKKEGAYTLFCGNMIENNKKNGLKKRLDIVNEMSMPELEDWYNTILLKDEPLPGRGAGLGLIDIRLKSQRKLEYQLFSVSEKESFFVIQATIPTE